MQEVIKFSIEHMMLSPAGAITLVRHSIKAVARALDRSGKAGLYMKHL